MMTRYMRCSRVDFLLKRVLITVGIFDIVVANVAIIVETEHRSLEILGEIFSHTKEYGGIIEVR